MTSHYDHAQVQEFWQYVWERDEVYELDPDVDDPTYVLGMFPYTSGTLHMGHVRNYAITDAHARYRRMCGDDVLHPMGWDAFGLPAENAAYERASDPESWTQACIRRMREELETMGFGYDWSREITTCEPDYYQWNQWLFKRLYEAGLVEYEAASVNWCPDCETVLAEAQVEEREAERSEAATRASGEAEGREVEQSETSNGASGEAASREVERVCWRCETPVGRRELDQWFFAITDYAEELHDALEGLEEWPEGVREIQRNWIGRQEGVRIAFEVSEPHDGLAEPSGDEADPRGNGTQGSDAADGTVDVFSTRPETIYGATYLAVSPGHDLARELADADEAVREYVETVRERPPEAVGFSGIATDATAVHPLTGEELPVYVAGYVLEDVGTGAVMGVPAHNERDHAFASEHGLPIESVITPKDATVDVDLEDEPYTGEGILEASGEYDGLESETARERLLADVAAIEEDVIYRLRDWLISRQRYWGTPIPVVHCDDCGHVPVPDEELPVELPEFVHTTGNPLAEHESFRHTECPDCGGPAERETDTMDTFVDSSWYFLRFLSPDLEDAPFDAELANDALPIDVYVGGDEHAVLHLLYIRFMMRALADLGLLEVREPVERLISQGTVLYDGEKMSTSKGNVVAPLEYGAETTRLFVLSAAHPEQDFEWTANNVRGAYDLQQTLYGMATEFVDEGHTRVESEIHDEFVAREIDRTIAAVADEYERFRFHRAATEIQELARLLRRYRAYDRPHGEIYRRGLLTLAALIAPMAPHLAEELWNKLRGDGLVVEADWPEPEADVADYATERRFVETTLEDVRDIVDVAAIDEPARIELVVAPEWKYRVAELAADRADGEPIEGDAIVERAQTAGIDVPDRETLGTFVGDLVERTTRSGLDQFLPAGDERAILERTSWLLTDEFDVDVVVRRATDDDDLAAKARPGKPAIRID
ncbi:leucine--tRNA ligase [Natrarchaeobaculum sulfurireducens]|uniref:leucine--tRNA ligase n=1 Tax=Natrarchaeobaculum sulfurireducens TaxID=2044521 RepID=A0A346PH96_9EURY|nr:leucine--tRNA ligase [Natrarchaeobaculum sulfurireducens]AXR78891.1 Valyl-tRNA synthetase [Natrarchaeobaculum sulfurireducens]